MNKNEHYNNQVIWEEGRVAALSHTYAVKSPLVTLARPKFATKSTPSREPIPTTCLIPGPVRLTVPNGIRIRSAVCQQCTGQTDRRNARTDNRARESLITIGRCATRATRPNNKLIMHVTSHSAGGAAKTASVRKESKNSALPSDYIF